MCGGTKAKRARTQLIVKVSMRGSLIPSRVLLTVALFLLYVDSLRTSSIIGILDYGSSNIPMRGRYGVMEGLQNRRRVLLVGRTLTCKAYNF